MKERKTNQRYYLTCERDWVYFTLITVAGFWGAYTYILRGHVFCNAQTSNVVLMGVALGSAQWGKGLYYLIPISAYILGAFVSELVPNPIKHHFFIRWDTLLMFIEIVAVIGLGLIPESAPVQISQVLINFLASMQYNTFRQAEGVSVATTFVSNHVRQIGVGLATELRHWRMTEKPHRKKLLTHLGMLGFFILGVLVGAICCHLMVGKAIWITAIPLGVVFVTLLHADLTTEKDLVETKPSGH